MVDHLALKTLAIALILFSGAAAPAVVLVQHDAGALLQHAPSSNRCEQAMPGVCETRCRSKDDCALEWVKH